MEQHGLIYNVGNQTSLANSTDTRVLLNLDLSCLKYKPKKFRL